MLTVTPSRTNAFDVEVFEQFIASRREPEWVTDLRRNAFEIYRELLVTELDPEEWKRVDIRAFRAEKFSIPTSTKPIATFDTLLADRAEFAGFITHIDTVSSQPKLDEERDEQSVNLRHAMRG